MTTRQWKNLMVLVLAFWLVLMLVPVVAKAGEVTLSWTNPTQQESCTNAGPLPDLAGTRIWMRVAEIDDPTAESVTLPALLPGTYQYVATSYDADGHESRVTQKAEKVIDTFKVGVDNTVYTTVKAEGKFLLIATGTVPEGTDCSTTQSVNGHYVVDPDLVAWSGTVSTFTPVAKCE